jgi:putative hydrolase of the HAD superfamily
VIFDFAGVLTSNMVEVIAEFEAREVLPNGLYLRAWATPQGQDLYRRLELGEITQAEWNEQFGALLNIPGENLMGRFSMICGRPMRC